jgi:hypothetical protein
MPEIEIYGLVTINETAGWNDTYEMFALHQQDNLKTD